MVDLNLQLRNVFLLCVFTPLQLISQNKNNYLEPVKSFFDLAEFQIEYYSDVREILFEDLGSAPVIRFQIIPSFSPESVLQIEYDRKIDKYFLVFHIGEESIWYSNSRQSIKVKRYKKEINRENALLIRDLYRIIINQTRMPKDGSYGLDGANYYFSIFDHRMKSGTCWSPPEESLLGNLVSISNELSLLVIENIEYIEFTAEFVVRINALKNKFLE